MIADRDVPELQLEGKNDVKGLRIFKVPAMALDDVWSYVLTVLRRHPELWNRYNTEESLYESFKDGSCVLWLVLREADIVMMYGTQVVHYPTGRGLSVFWGVGRGMEEWLPLVLSTLYNFAARAGLNWVNIDGRLGWKAPLAAHGYELTSSRFTKQVFSTEMVN